MYNGLVVGVVNCFYVHGHYCLSVSLMFQRWERFDDSIPVKVSMFLINTYLPRVISAVVAIVLVMVGAMINIGVCEDITPNTNVCHKLFVRDIYVIYNVTS